MQIELDYLIKAIKEEIPASDAIILYLLYNKEDKYLEKYLEGIYRINPLFNINVFLLEYQNKGYIKILEESTINNLDFRNSFVSLIPTSNNPDVEQLAKDYLALWPEGIKSMGRYVRASEEDLVILLNKFLRKYKKQKFSNETILNATRKYIEEKRKVNWSYITCSDYFISKNNISLLASYCANLGVKEQTKVNYTQTL